MTFGSRLKQHWLGHWLVRPLFAEESSLAACPLFVAMETKDVAMSSQALHTIVSARSVRFGGMDLFRSQHRFHEAQHVFHSFDAYFSWKHCCAESTCDAEPKKASTTIITY